MEQKTEFVRKEADAWFERNQHILQKSYENDIIVELIREYNIKPKRILEIGCSGGYRLNQLKQEYPETEVWGIDPSAKAIAYGQEAYPNINLSTATADEMTLFEDSKFDLVIIGFVFYVVDRNLLYKSVAEIDRVIQNNGCLVTLDFYTERTRRNHYEHIKEFQAYSYKQTYENLFLSSDMYLMLDKSTFDHNNRVKLADEDYGNKISLVLMKKDTNAKYI